MEEAGLISLRNQPCDQGGPLYWACREALLMKADGATQKLAKATIGQESRGPDQPLRLRTEARIAHSPSGSRRRPAEKLFGNLPEVGAGGECIMRAARKDPATRARLWRMERARKITAAHEGQKASKLQQRQLAGYEQINAETKRKSIAGKDTTGSVEPYGS